MESSARLVLARDTHGPEGLMLFAAVLWLADRIPEKSRMDVLTCTLPDDPIPYDELDAPVLSDSSSSSAITQMGLSW